MPTRRITLAPPIRKRTRIGRVVEDRADRGVRGRFPEELAGEGADGVPAREEDVFAVEVLDDLPTTAQGGKLLKDQGQHMTDVLIGIFDDTAVRKAH